MKQPSQVFITEISKENPKLFLLLKLHELQFRTTTLPFDVTFQNELYICNNKIKAIQAPKASSVIDREAFTISLVDLDFSFKNYFDGGATGDTVSLRMGVIANDTPLLSLNDTLLLLEGVIDSASVDVNHSEDTVTANLEISSPLAALDRRNTYFTSKRSYLEKTPNSQGDTSFDQIHVGSGQAVLKWGKA